MENFKRVNKYLFLGSLALFVISYIFLARDCFSECEYRVATGILDPISYAALFLIAVTFALQFLPTKFFKNWLLYIASWYIPLSILYVSTISVYGGSIMSVDRSTAVVWLGSLLVLITILSVLYQKRNL